jgi:hypothetical protein
MTTGWFWSGALGTSEIDWAAKSSAAGTGAGLQMVDSFVFGYATYAHDVGCGPGAETIVSFYEGTTGFCNLGNPGAHFRFSGLPGATCCGIGGGGYEVTAFVEDPGFCLPDGMIGVGYSFIQDRGLSTGAPPSGFSATGAILVNFGTNFPYGWTDAFDWCVGGPNSFGSCIGTYWFGGCNTAQTWGAWTTGCASFYMALREVDSAQAAVTVWNTGSNPLFLSALNLPRVGSTFQIDHTQPGGYGLSLARYAVGIPLSGPMLHGDLHLDLGQVYRIRFGAATTKNIQIPCDSSLIGSTVHVQGVHLTGTGPLTLQLQNTLDVSIGG